jgi:hypothetical protein
LPPHSARLQSDINKLISLNEELKVTSQNEIENNNYFLFECFPNPSESKTSIRYFLPDNAVSSKIVIFNKYGETVNEFLNLEFGMNTISFDSQGLDSGIYIISLFNKDQIVNSVKFIKI